MNLRPARRTLYELACHWCSWSYDTISFVDGIQQETFDPRCPRPGCGGRRYVDYGAQLANKHILLDKELGVEVDPLAGEPPLQRRKPGRKKGTPSLGRPRVRQCSACGGMDVPGCGTCKSRRGVAKWRERAGR